MPLKEDEPAKAADEAGVVVNGPETVEAIPASITPAEMNERNRRYWEQPGGEFFENE